MNKRRSSSKGMPRLGNSPGNMGMVNQPDDAMIVDHDGGDAIPSTQRVDDRVLKDVVAYVEVRSKNENRSRSVRKQLELLGATVVVKFGCEVTHVIWKEGRKSTKDKALKKGLHLVSVLWVDSCKQNQEHVAESLFPVHDPEDGSLLILAKIKRVKSMQPSTFEDELNGDAPSKRRRKRKLVAEDFQPLCLKNVSPVVRPRPKILVEDTQPPMSPLIVGPTLTPTLSLIPNTPENMRRALDSLRRRRETPNRNIFSSADESPSSALVAPLLNKKLFLNSATSSCSDTDAYSNKTVPSSKSIDASDSSDTEKQQRPTKRQRLSSAKKEGLGPKTKSDASHGKNGEIPGLLDGLDIVALKGSKIFNGRLAEVSTVKKGRRSSIRLQRHSAESEEKTEGTGCLAKEVECVKSCINKSSLVNDRLTKVKIDTSKGKKGRRSSMRISKQLSDHQVNEEDESDALTSPGKSSNEKNTLHSSMNQSAQQECSTSIQGTVPLVAKKKKRKLMSMSSQAEPPTELIVPTQSNTKRTANMFMNDPHMFPSFGEDEENVPETGKRKRRTQKNTSSSSRKRKNVGLSSESENEPPNGSQNHSQGTIIHPLIPTCRRSLEDFKDSQSTKKKSWASLAKKRKTNNNTLSEINSSLPDSWEDVLLSQDSVSGKTRTTKENGKGCRVSKQETSTDSDSADSILDVTKSKKKIRKADRSVRKTRKNKPTMVMTSMHVSDQGLVLSVAKALKHFKLVDTVCDTTTHIVCGDNRRTLNVLSGIARGCWLLSMQWVLNSVEAGHWLPEEPYELHDYFPAAQVSRLECKAAGPTCYKQNLFAPPGCIYITEDSSPPQERLVELVELCGGQVTHRLRDATLCVGKANQELNIPVVAELWVLDCITQHCQMPLEPYFLHRRCLTSSMDSASGAFHG